DFATPLGTQGAVVAPLNDDGRFDVVTANNGPAGTVSVLLQSSVTLSPSSLGFGDQNVGTTSQPQTGTLTNNTETALNITSFTFTGANSGDFSQTNNCGASVPAGGQCTINITFTPTFPGARSAFLNINDNDPSSPQLVTLSGNGIGPAVTFSPTFLS